MYTHQPDLPLHSLPRWEIFLAALWGLGLGVLTLISPAAGLTAGIGGIAVFLLLAKPILLGYLVIISTVLMSGMTRGALIPYLIPNEPVLFAAVVMSFPAIFSIKRRAGSKLNLLTVGMLVFMIGTSIMPMLQYRIRGESLSVKEMLILLAPLQYMLIFWLFRYLPATEEDIRGLVRCLFACAVVVSVVGFLQTAEVGIVLTALQNWYGSGHEEAALLAGRVTSLLGAWNSLGTFLMLNLVILRSLLGVQPAVMSNRNLVLVTLCCAGCLLASGSYAGLIGLVIGLLLVNVFEPKGRGAVWMIFLGMLVLALPLRHNIETRLAFQFQNDNNGSLIPQTLAFRFMVWQSVFLPVIRQYWLWGFHPVMPDTLAWMYPESQYLGMLLKGGIFYFLSHIVWVVCTAVWLFRFMRRSDGVVKALAVSAFTLLCVLSIMGLTNSVFTFSCVMEYIWIVLGLISAGGTNYETAR